MNIFAVDTDPEKAARSLMDEHVNKMILESVQMLNTALHNKGLREDNLKIATSTFYEPTHTSHPCVEWVGESRSNFHWLVRHAYYLNDEYMDRFDHDTGHKSWIKLMQNWGCDETPTTKYVTPMEHIQEIGLTKFPIATGDFEPDSEDPVEAYRQYYRNVKVPKDNMSYDRADSTPDWL